MFAMPLILPPPPDAADYAYAPSARRACAMPAAPPADMHARLREVAYGAPCLMLTMRAPRAQLLLLRRRAIAAMRVRYFAAAL